MDDESWQKWTVARLRELAENQDHTALCIIAYTTGIELIKLAGFCAGEETLQNWELERIYKSIK